MADLGAPFDLQLQVALAIRLLVAAILGAAIGIERELHSHPAGTRTHLLVALGSAVFTELSIYGFTGITNAGELAPVDPSRVAAQIVTGIGFLGAGAILKYGTSVRGLTTAASLWVTAAIGMAVGAGQWLMAVVCALIVVFSLGPLRALVARLRLTRGAVIELRLEAARLDAIDAVSKLLRERRVDIVTINSERVHQGRYEIELSLRLPPGVRAQDLITAIDAIPEVELVQAGPGSD
jgi:putative Mg2+ transporter-C (MgtC) family protein